MSDIITRTLYRSLLRTAKPFASPYNGPILCSLLYRLGLDDDEYLDTIRFEKLQKRTDVNANTDADTDVTRNASNIYSNSNEEEGSKSTYNSMLQPTTSSDHDHINISTSTANNKESHSYSPSFKDVHLSKEEARDLTKTYDELRKIHFDKESRGLTSTSSSSVNNDYNDNDTWSTIYNQDDDNNNQQIFLKSSTGISQNYLDLYKHVLRQLFFDEQENVLRQMQFPSQTTMRTDDTCKDQGNNNDNLVECIMGQKLIKLIQNEFRNKSTNSNIIYTDAIKRETGFLALRELQKKLTWAQSMGIHNDLFHYHEHRRINTEVCENEMKRRMDEQRYIQIQAVNDVNRISTKSSSLYLQSGVFLIAHPMLRGIFDRSVICILQHTNRKKMESNLEGFEELEDEDGDDEDTDMDISAAQNGGTYGLIINSPLTVGIPGSDPRSSSRRRNRTLREVIRYDSLPEGVRVAFGDSPVRNGGPVNLSIQMLRCASPEDEEKLKIGGTVLPQVLVNDDVSTAMYSDKAIYFGGDIIKAAQAVLDGDMDRGMYLCG